MIRVLRIALVTLLLDQATKLLVNFLLPEGESVVLLPGVLYFTHVRNYGAAFGLMNNRTGLFILVTVVAIAIIVLAYRRLAADRRATLRWALALQFGGALGNLIDRLRAGYVTDFIDLRIWPVFNLADVAIVAGVFLLCWEMLRSAQEGGTESGRLR